jgi:NAD(P)H dehydrogenase (quinone)
MAALGWHFDGDGEQRSMNILIVFAHPEPKSFNGALFSTAVRELKAAGHTVVTSDLYRMGFDPVSGRHNFTSVKDANYLKLQVEETHATECKGFAAEIENELRKLEACDLLLLQFPMWWFGMPAILKGWVDRVMAMGRTYGYGAIYDTGKFRGKRAMLSLTTGGPEESYLADGFNGDITAILRPIQRGILSFLGFDVLAPQFHFGPARASEDTRERWLADYARRLRDIGNEAPIEVGRY